MASPENNPYNSPSSDLNAEVKPSQRMHCFPRFSAWGVFGLAIITLGLYYVYWLYTRTLIINRVHDNKISMNMVYTVMGLLLANIIISFMSGANPDNMDYKMLTNLSSLAYSIGNLFWVFTVRNRIHQMAQVPNESNYWLNGVLTFSCKYCTCSTR